MNIRSSRWLSIVFVAAGLLFAGCQSAPAKPAQPAGPTEVHVKLSEFKVEVDKANIPAGPVKFIIDNMGAITHEVVLELATDMDKPLEAGGKSAEAPDIAPGKSTIMEWTIDKPGAYQLACHINDNGVDHFKNDMKTPLTVTAK